MSISTLTSEAEWISCGGCRGLIYGPRFDRDLRVCFGCGRHGRLTADQRIEQLLDPGTARRLDPPEVATDPLEFVDSQPYGRRLARARDETGLHEAVVCVTGELMGRPVVAAVMDFRFLGGSLGIGAGEAITAAAETALATRRSLIIVTASGGARMQEGAFSLMQMVKTSQVLGELDEAGILTVCVLTDPTFGGVAASFATLGDVVVAEPGARVGFAGRRVIEQTIGHALPDNFQTAEFLLERGLVDAVVNRSALRPTIGAVLETRDGGPRPAAPSGAVDLVRDPGRLPEVAPEEVIRLARHPGRPSMLDYLAHVTDGFLELKGDRIGGDCPALIGGLARIDGRSVVVLGFQKGRDTTERVRRNFAMALPEGYRKAARLMRLAAKLGLPVVTLVDTPGAHPGMAAEEGGQAWAIANNLRLMSGLPVPIVAVITGEGGSGGALALAVADRVLAFSGAMYSVISPEGCAAILWKDPAAAPRAAAALQIGARDLLRHRIVDAVVPEPAGGAHQDPVGAAERLRAAVTETLREVAAIPSHDLAARRRRRFRQY
ncbi:acetyl-CoA carboxylase carboxyltransferase subunit alpha [Micromonospora sp. RTGN7]|uniref:acetyl-CoA carboxylase carboxyltransferase subunit alpha n=1 Tax=Micromonospora sp. RTGN7 TaxID=3016526 RepID=UPI0029FED7D8|nr:acetyl-CoA carboxylase carboxyltransferase subunit alpha [Micromonospora sp. RTGN7]